MLNWILCVAASGVLLKIAAPPINAPFVALLAFCPLIYAISRGGFRNSFIAGFCVGLFWRSDLPIALIGWGLILPFGAWIANGIVLGVCAGVSGLLTQQADGIHRSLIFPCAWTISCFVSQELLGLPVGVAPLLSFTLPKVLTLGQSIGPYGIEFLVLFINSTLLESLRSRKKVEIVTFVCVSSLTWFFSTKNGDKNVVLDGEEISVSVVQPSIEHSDRLRAKSSPFHRNQQEEVVDKLTEISIANTSVDIVIWPEGGNGLANTNLKRRKNALENMIQRDDIELLVAGPDYDLDGQKYNSVALFKSTGLAQVARKTITAPIAESQLGHGIPTVFESQFGRLGIAICFEALFFKHFKSLAEKNAQLFIVVTDDSSLLQTYLQHVHAAYAIANSAIYGVPLVFVNNGGISLVSNSQGEITDIDEFGGEASVFNWKVKLGSTVTNSCAYWMYSIPLILSLLYILHRSMNLYAGKPRRSPAFKKRLISSDLIISPEFRHMPTIATFCTVLIAIPVDALITSIHRNETYAHFSRDLIARLYVAPTLDGYSPLFKQTSEQSCGAAALAFVLTKLGDRISEYRILNEFPHAEERGYSMFELIKIAEFQGFEAKGVRLQTKDFPQTGGLPIIAHVDNSHFVVVLNVSDNQLIFYDPAYGQTLYQSESVFAKRWSGKSIVINYGSSNLVQGI